MLASGIKPITGTVNKISLLILFLNIRSGNLAMCSQKYSFIGFL